jgi:hypothetical protein
MLTCRDTVAEGIEGKQADLFEEIGVDTDEAIAAAEGGPTYNDLLALQSSNRRPSAAAGAAGIKRQRC